MTNKMHLELNFLIDEYREYMEDNFHDFKDFNQLSKEDRETYLEALKEFDHVVTQLRYKLPKE